jgi:hypothetical protein
VFSFLGSLGPTRNGGVWGTRALDVKCRSQSSEPKEAYGWVRDAVIWRAWGTAVLRPTRTWRNFAIAGWIYWPMDSRTNVVSFSRTMLPVLEFTEAVGGVMRTRGWSCTPSKP